MLIICSGMLRSGSTLQYNLARLLVEKSNLGTGGGYFLPEQLGNLRIKQEIIDWGRDGKLHVIKTHDGIALTTEFKGEVEPDMIRMLYVYRDIRDVAASLRRKENSRLKVIFDKLDNAIKIYEEMTTTTGVFVQKYEDLIKDIALGTIRLREYLEIKTHHEVIEAIAQECSVNNVAKVIDSTPMSFNFRVKNVLKSLGLPIPHIVRTMIPNDVTLLHRDHISVDKGAVGAWRKVFSDKEIKEIASRYVSWLNDNGYLAED